MLLERHACQIETDIAGSICEVVLHKSWGRIPCTFGACGIGANNQKLLHIKTRLASTRNILTERNISDYLKETGIGARTWHRELLVLLPVALRLGPLLPHALLGAIE